MIKFKSNIFELVPRMLFSVFFLFYDSGWTGGHCCDAILLSSCVA